MAACKGTWSGSGTIEYANAPQPTDTTEARPNSRARHRAYFFPNASINATAPTGARTFAPLIT
jgi:hypothetical protein